MALWPSSPESIWHHAQLFHLLHQLAGPLCLSSFRAGVQCLTGMELSKISGMLRLWVVGRCQRDKYVLSVLGDFAAPFWNVGKYMDCPWSMKRKKCQKWHGLWIQQECIHTHTYMVCPCFSINIPTTTSADECVQGAELKLIAEGWRSLWSISWRSSPGAPLTMLPSCGKVSFLGSPWFNDLISDPSLVTPAVSGTHWWHLTPWHRHWWANCSSPGTTNSLWVRSSQMIYGLKWIRDSVIHPMFSFTLNHILLLCKHLRTRDHICLNSTRQ